MACDELLERNHGRSCCSGGATLGREQGGEHVADEVTEVVHANADPEQGKVEQNVQRSVAKMNHAVPCTANPFRLTPTKKAAHDQGTLRCNSGVHGAGVAATDVAAHVHGAHL